MGCPTHSPLPPLWPWDPKLFVKFVAKGLGVPCGRMRVRRLAPKPRSSHDRKDAARSCPQSQHMTGTVLPRGFQWTHGSGIKKQEKLPLTSAFLPDSLLVEPSIMVGLGPVLGTQIIQRSGMKLSDKLLRSPGLCDLGKGGPGGNAVTGFSLGLAC